MYVFIYHFIPLPMSVCTAMAAVLPEPEPVEPVLQPVWQLWQLLKPAEHPRNTGLPAGHAAVGSAHLPSRPVWPPSPLADGAHSYRGIPPCLSALQPLSSCLLTVIIPHVSVLD